MPLVLPDAKYSNLTIAPQESALECIFIKDGDKHVPVLIRDTPATPWKINPDLK